MILRIKSQIILFILLTCCLCLFIASHSYCARNHIKIVGSSTVYPFTTIVAEEFGYNTNFRTPIVESTGTGGGLKLFCSGIGKNYPDFTNASRAIKNSEIKRCINNGISRPIEIKIGYDGVVLAHDISSESLNLTKRQIFLAMANKVPLRGKIVDNFYEKWSDIDKSLPNVEIAVYGPPATSGTRDSFVELVLEKFCVNIPEFIKYYPDKKARKSACHVIRSDGKFIEAGENDNLIVQKLKGNKDALGIFGFSFLQQNSNVVRGVKIDNIHPSSKNISSGKYKISRPLFIYMKKEHLDKVTGMKEFVTELVSYDAIGNDGYLVERGLTPLRKKELDLIRKSVNILY